MTAVLNEEESGSALHVKIKLRAASKKKAIFAVSKVKL